LLLRYDCLACGEFSITSDAERHLLDVYGDAPVDDLCRFSVNAPAGSMLFIHGNAHATDRARRLMMKYIPK
jgi:hypothetical protein